MNVANAFGKVKDFVSSGWGRWVAAFLVALALFGGGYGFGRYGTPAKVVTKDHVVEKLVDKIVYQDKVVEKVVYVKVAKKDEHVVTTTTKKPDGTVTTTVVKDEHVATNTSTNTDKIDTVNKTEDKKLDKVEDHTKLVLNQPNWRVAVGAGYSIPFALGQPSPGIPGLQGAVLQVEVDRRVAGPFWLGVFGNSQGVLGVNLGAVL